MARHPIAIQFAVDDRRPADAQSLISMSGRHVITVHTTLVDPMLTVDLHSTFVSGTQSDTAAIHLCLGPADRAEHLICRDYAVDRISTIHSPAACIDEHWCTLIDFVGEFGHTLRINPSTRGIDALAAAAADA